MGALTGELAPATTEPHSGPDYDRFCAGVRSLCGVELAHYRRPQMERRLRSFAERCGESDLDGYLGLLKRDESAREGFLDRMTINVSELFRNPERFEELERQHLPALAGSGGPLRVWSAGCSYGAEAYTLAILLAETSAGHRAELVASDIDETVLVRAREGWFGPTDLRNVTPERLRDWFEDPGSDGRRRVAGGAREIVRFRRLDLLKEQYPQRCDLILCRNVVIYFNEDAKSEIYRRFFEALRPGGVLFVGSTERIERAERMGWEKAGTFFYRRPA